MDREEINLISSLANIRITKEERDGFIKDFTDILSYFGKIGNISVNKKTDKRKDYTPLREDKIVKSSPIVKEENYYDVPIIF